MKKSVEKKSGLVAWIMDCQKELAFFILDFSINTVYRKSFRDPGTITLPD